MEQNSNVNPVSDGTPEVDGKDMSAIQIILQEMHIV